MAQTRPSASGRFDITSAGGTVFNGAKVYTSGAQSYASAVQVGVNTTFSGSALSFDQTLTGAGYDIILNSQGLELRIQSDSTRP